ncbi:hypothetical protein ES703_114033 [subsurface metagenome]
MAKQEWRHTRIEGNDVYQERVVLEEKLIEEEIKEEEKDWANYRRRNQKTGKVEPGSHGKKDFHVKGKKK